MSALTILITLLIIGIVGGSSYILLQEEPQKVIKPTPPIEKVSQEGGEELVLNGSSIKVKAAEGQCLGISGGMSNLKNGILPKFFPCDDRLNQQWNYDVNSNEITTAGNTNYCLDVPKGDASNGKGLIMWECHKEDNQKWTIDNKQISTQLNEKKCATYNSQGHLEIQDCASNEKQTFY